MKFADPHNAIQVIFSAECHLSIYDDDLIVLIFY